VTGTLRKKGIVKTTKEKKRTQGKGNKNPKW
jgi:hypothetical protein